MKEKLCRLCLGRPSGTQLIEIDEITKEILDILLLKPINLDISQERATCIKCAENLQKYFDFKSECFYTEDFIIPFVDPEGSTDLNLKEIFMRKEEIAQTVYIHQSQKICRLCLELLTDNSFISLCGSREGRNSVQDLVQKYIPELNLTITKAPVMCTTCLECLKNYSNFVENCMATEAKINAYCKSQGIDRNGQVKLNDVEQFQLKQTLKHKVLYDTRKDNSSKVILKREHLEGSELDQNEHIDENCEIKAEFEEDVILTELKEEIDIEQHNIKSPVVPLEMLKPSNIACKKRSRLHKRNIQTNNSVAKPKVYQCKICTFQTKYRISSINHDLIHKDPSEIVWFQCQLCPYKSKRKDDLNRHVFRHNKLPEQQIYACDKCTYRTNCPKYLGRHTKVHLDPSEIKWFYCPLCTHKTKRQNRLKKHILIHNKQKEDIIYKCDKCPYQAKLKCVLKAHMVSHTDPSDLKMYSCKLCSFESKYSGSLIQHMRKHQNQPEYYKCKVCDFATIYKESFKRHTVTHKAPSDILMYKCNQCPYKCAEKARLPRHIIVNHMDRSKITSYKCDQCAYKSPIKSDLKRHILIHKDPSEVKLYFCNLCSYKSRYKKRLNRHMFIHKDCSEVTMFKCEICTFETRHKEYLRKHILIHDPLKRTVYCCDTCGFTSFNRGSFRTHLQGHKKIIVK